MNIAEPAKIEQSRRTRAADTDGHRTDRDSTVSIVAPDLDPDTLLAGDVMGTELIAMREDAGISETVELVGLLDEMRRFHRLRATIETFWCKPAGQQSASCHAIAQYVLDRGLCI